MIHIYLYGPDLTSVSWVLLGGLSSSWATGDAWSITSGHLSLEQSANFTLGNTASMNLEGDSASRWSTFG